jgi:hypothetical protein
MKMLPCPLSESLDLGAWKMSRAADVERLEVLLRLLFRVRVYGLE